MSNNVDQDQGYREIDLANVGNYLAEILGIAGYSMHDAGKELEKGKPNYQKVYALATLSNAGANLATAIMRYAEGPPDDTDVAKGDDE